MKKVVIGMSGGVDSSVAAIILKRQGYEVIGLFMRNWDSTINNDYLGNPNLDNNICPQEEDYNDAKAVCDKIGIPLYRVDFVKEYWDYVFTYFLDELKKGRTPNPDIMCNKYIKFDYFIKKAKELGADYIATGHYARIKDGYLLRGVDDNKDQTYFLSQLSHEQLENVLCFIGERNFKQFLKNYLPNQPGDVIDIDTGKKVGEHIGLMYYTIGQRKGLDIGGFKDKMFVVGKDLNKNVLYISFGEDTKYLISNSCIIDTVNFNCSDRPTSCTAKFRYRQKDYPVNLEYLDNGEIIVSYDNVKSVTPGQACVFYNGEKCLGGGIIKEVRYNNEKLWYLL